VQSSYQVEDKKQVADFDPQAWLEENEVAEEEEETTSCPVCNLADNEEVLLLCDGCDASYHTYCIGLDDVPDGSWFCMECRDTLGLDEDEAAAAALPSPDGQRNGRRSNYFPRTQASMRRARRRARSDMWLGAWGAIAGRIFDATSIDINNHGEEEDSLRDLVWADRLDHRDRRRYEAWQQRLQIASRQGARDVFANNIPFARQPRSMTPAPLRGSELSGQQADDRQTEPRHETAEARLAWSALERVTVDAAEPSNRRKRTARSISSSPVEPRQEPERRLKRPRTRRLATQNEASSSSHSPAIVPQRPDRSAAGPTEARSPRAPPEGPTFLSSLLREVEMSTPSDDENARSHMVRLAPHNDASSPVTSPSASGYSSPRALSLTPPPQRTERPSSPAMSLSSHVEAVFPPANFSPTRDKDTANSSDTDSHRLRNGENNPEIRQPRPQRVPTARLPRSEEVSPARSPLPIETKENISGIVRHALKPHWRSSEITAEQYANINRDVSRKIYEEVTDPAALTPDVRLLWEKLAIREVAKAVADLKA
jgi:hypothetical protein